MTPINVFALVVDDWSRRRLSGPPFFFVEIGAHDGKHLDPIYDCVTERGWHGVLIEPQPSIFELPGNRQPGRRDGLEFLQCGIMETDGFGSITRFKDGQGLDDHSTMLASFNPVSVENNLHGHKGELESVKVPVMSPKTLCDKYPQDWDLLQVDTEGFDEKIILGILAAGKRPAIIHFESAWRTPSYKPLISQLYAAGYRMDEIGLDTICYRQRDEKFDRDWNTIMELCKISGVHPIAK